MVLTCGGWQREKVSPLYSFDYPFLSLVSPNCLYQIGGLYDLVFPNLVRGDGVIIFFFCFCLRVWILGVLLAHRGCVVATYRCSSCLQACLGVASIFMIVTACLLFIDVVLLATRSFE